jgi:pimeloyl-ACP methyl ester carboxylesterase
MLPEKKFDAKGVSINYAEGPSSGPPLVLLHGLPGCWQEFLPILPHLMLRWHIYALDFRGEGNSGRVAGQYHSSFYSKDHESFLQQQVAERAVIFGNSAGGLIALNAASIVPEWVKAVIVGDSPIDIEWLVVWMTSPGFKSWFTALRSIAAANHTVDETMKELAAVPVAQEGDALIRYGDQPGIDQTHLRNLALTLKHLDPSVLEYHAEGRAEEYLQGYDLNRILDNITCPVLLIQANPELGGLMTDRSVENALARLKHGSHVLIKTAGHDLGMESWEVGPLLRVVTAFLDSL